MKERDVIAKYMLAASADGARLFRNNTAMAWAGKASHRGRDVLVRNAYPIHAGLCQGSSDLIGWTTITITADMVGQQVAIFTAVEIKTGRTATTELQEHFLDQVRKAGGIAKVERPK